MESLEGVSGEGSGLAGDLEDLLSGGGGGDDGGGGGGGEHDNYVVHDDKGEMMTLAVFGTDGDSQTSEISEKF